MIPSLQRLQQRDPEFATNLHYTVSASPDGATSKDSVKTKTTVENNLTIFCNKVTVTNLVFSFSNFESETSKQNMYGIPALKRLMLED